MTHPIRELEAWAAWCAEAKRLGLGVGERFDFTLFLHDEGAPPYRPAGLRRILDRATAAARSERDLFRLVDVVSGAVDVAGHSIEGSVIVIDPAGCRDNLAKIAEQLRDRAATAHREVVLEEVARIGFERTARRWPAGHSERTIRRWDAENPGKIAPPVATASPESRSMIEAEPVACSRAGSTTQPATAEPAGKDSAA